MLSPASDDMTDFGFPHEVPHSQVGIRWVVVVVARVEEEVREREEELTYETNLLLF